MKHLILNADDFAFNAAVSRGIVTLAQKGRLTATSAMTLSPRWATDAPALAEFRAQIDVGLHLDWTSPFAINAGHGFGLKRAMLSAVLGGFNKTTARVVIERQLDAFEQVWASACASIQRYSRCFGGHHGEALQRRSQRSKTVFAYFKRCFWLAGCEG